MKKLTSKLSFLLALLIILTGCKSTSAQNSPSPSPTVSPIVSVSPSATPSPTPSPIASVLFTPSSTVAADAENGGAVTAAEAPAPTLSTKQETPVEATVYVTKTGSKYHRDGCRYLKKSKIAISLSDAKADGYTPCSVCNPPE